MHNARTRPLVLLLATLALLLIAASRVSPIRETELEADEMNNIYLSLGAPADTIARTPYDWVPGGFLMMGAWTSLVGLHPFVLRWLPLLTFLIGCAFTYRLLLRWRDHETALLGMLAYGGLGLHLFLSIYTRGYVYPLALLPCALWLTCRYFDHPGWRRAVPLAVVMIAMFYTQLTSAVAFVMLGVYTLVVYRARVWRWWMPALLALPFALPEILRQRDILAGRIAGIPARELPPLPQALIDLFTNYAGAGVVLWAVLLVIGIIAAAGVIVTPERGTPRPYGRSRASVGSPRRVAPTITPIPSVLKDSFASSASSRFHLISLALLIWVLLAPVAMYLLNDNLGFFSGRYSWWIALGIALLVAWGLGALPRGGRIAAGVLLAALVFAPLPPTGYYAPEPPLLANMRWLAGQYRAGDVLVRDPAQGCGAPEEWEILTRAFFPNSLRFDSAPRDHQRVWYVSFDGREDPALGAAVRKGRVAGRFVGPAGCLFRLYEAPPDAHGIAFENGMRFHGMQVLDDGGLVTTTPLVRRERDALRLRLWWSADAPIDRDYSVGIFLAWRDGTLIVQNDSAPQVVVPEGAPVETSRWAQDTIYIEERTLTLPEGLRLDTAQLALTVYGWWDNRRLDAPGVDDAGLLPLADVAIAAW